jgi:hypothetical protein
MKGTRPKRTGKGREAADIGKIVANALAQRKSKQEIVHDLVKRGLTEESAREWVRRAIPW